MFALLQIVIGCVVIVIVTITLYSYELIFFTKTTDTNKNIIIYPTHSQLPALKIYPTLAPTTKPYYRVGTCEAFPKSVWFLNPMVGFQINKRSPINILNDLDVMMMPRREEKVCWELPVFAELVRLKKEKKKRPVMLYLAGEVFSSPSRKPCNNVDAAVYRSLEEQPRGCPTIHYIQANQLAHQFNKVDKMLHHTVPEKTSTPMNFCAFITKSTFLRNHYKQADALIRHAMFSLLSEYKKCKRPRCRGGFWDTKECYKNFKFAITMENTAERGYVTEKLFSGIMGDTMPIYFGAPDIGTYVNTKRFIHCKISNDDLKKFRKHFKRPNFYFNGFNSRNQPTDKELVEWAARYLRKYLKPCVDEVIFLDNNQTAYEEKLRQNFYRRNRKLYYEGRYERNQLEEIRKNLY